MINTMRCGMAGLSLLSVLSLCLLSLQPVSAERRSEVEIIDIDRPLVFIMDFSKGDRMALSATVSSVGSPISIFLIKGTISYNDWVRSEEVDLDDIKTGNASSGTNTTFLVVSNFSLMNTTGFEGRIEIGDKDVYYLVIALHRYAGMPAKDILLMTSTVDYDVSWEFEEKDIPLWLVPIAVLFFVVGVALVVYSLWKRTPRAPEGPETREASRTQSKEQRRPHRKTRRGPSDPR